MPSFTFNYSSYLGLKRKLHHMMLQSRKFKKVFTLVLVLTLFFLFIQNFLFRLTESGGGLYETTSFSKTFFSFTSILSRSNAKEKFLVNTPTCTIPVTKIMPQYFVDKWEEYENKTFPKYPDCSEWKKYFSVVTLGGDQFAKFHKDAKGDCQMWEVLPHPESDNKFKTKDLGPVDDKTFVNVTSIEMFMVKCNGSYNYEATLPMKPEAAKKVRYWQQQQHQQKQQDNKKRPISILFFGTDSTSRSHVHRSLPKMVKIMKEELGFIEFQGYHSVETSTLRNFMGFLMGLTNDEVRASCAENWSSRFDDCPFIWKIFEDHHYVTMFTEDTTGTFNWGGQSGFKKKPTDYYIKPIFRAISDQEDDYCLSQNETLTQFEFRYLTRFLEKFNGTPTFSFTWFNNPYHNSDKGLRGAVVDFENFFSRLKTWPEVLRSSFIVYLGDHGDRMHLASSDCIEGHIEKSLPPLFIRIPDDLVADYPELKLNAEMNTKKLTTAFDVHHTFLHILSLTGFDPSGGGGGHKKNNSMTSSNFNPILKDRSSLFAKIFDNRTCLSVNIDEDACVCNATEDAKSLDSPYLSRRIHDFVVDELNKIVKESRYKDDCEHLEPDDEPKASAKVIEQTDQFAVVIFNFGTDEDSQFECQLRVVYDNSTEASVSAAGVSEGGHVVHHFEMMSDFTRVNLYGDQSWCVGYESDEDKRMKNICKCKEDKPKETRTTTTTVTMETTTTTTTIGTTKETTGEMTTTTEES